MNAPARLRTRQVAAAAIIDLEGDLSHEWEGPLSATLRDPQIAGRGFVLLNFQAVGYINSAGISALVSLIAENRDSHWKLLACSLSSHYQKIFRMVGLSDFLPIYESEVAALEAISGHPAN